MNEELKSTMNHQSIHESTAVLRPFVDDCSDTATRSDPSLLSSSAPPLFQKVHQALTTNGYCVLPRMLTATECDDAVHLVRDFITDTTRTTGENVKEESPLLSNNEKKMFQSNGAGFVLGQVREVLADRVFAPIYLTRELHTSKEGFAVTYCDERSCQPDQSSTTTTETSVQFKTRGSIQIPLQEKDVVTIRSLAVLGDEYENDDGGGACPFVCWPKSFEPHIQAALSTNEEDDAETITTRLQDKFGLQRKPIYLAKGDVLLWRSDLIYQALPQKAAAATNDEDNVSSPADTPHSVVVVSYCAMQPAAWTPPAVMALKMDAYKERRTGNSFRPDVESWTSNNNSTNTQRSYSNTPTTAMQGRQYFRTSPPLVTERQAELYGLLPYTNDATERAKAIQRATIRGVRFCPTAAAAKTEENNENNNLHFWRSPALPPHRRGSARLEILHADPEFASDMEGADKWLGGMASPCGRYIYGVPGSARRVLRIHTATGRMDCIGPEFAGKFKWLRGVEVPATPNYKAEYPLGCCLALPCNHASILKINSHTDKVYAFGQDVLKDCGATNWLYHGGNRASNGYIYAIPANAERVLKFHPFTDEICFIGPRFEGKAKWYGGIVGSDGCIWGIPHNHSMVLRIDPRNDEVSLLGQSAKDDNNNESRQPLADGKWKWHGGLRAGNKIIGFPNNSDAVLVIDCSNYRIYTIGDVSILQSGRHRIPQDDRYKYLGGALTQNGRYAFLFPCDAERVLRIDCVEDKLELVGPLLLEGENKFQNGFVGRDGALYGIPQRSCGVLRIVTDEASGESENDHVDLMDCGEDLVGYKDKFEGGVLGADGCIYCIPLRAKICVKIIP